MVNKGANHKPDTPPVFFDLRAESKLRKVITWRQVLSSLMMSQFIVINCESETGFYKIKVPYVDPNRVWGLLIDRLIFLLNGEAAVKLYCSTNTRPQESLKTDTRSVSGSVLKPGQVLVTESANLGKLLGLWNRRVLRAGEMAPFTTPALSSSCRATFIQHLLD